MVAVVEQTDQLRAIVAEWRRAGERVAFVPTMGNLHAGHVSLVKAASKHAQRVVVSIFVNPLQFGPGEDFDAYPRTVEQDLEALKNADTDVLFLPQVAQMYPTTGQQVGGTTVSVPDLPDELCGASRPGHFTGVATVVTKLLNLVQPDVMMLGKKDYQQWRVLERCVLDLCLPVQVIGCQTMREADGLAMSSRNGYLSEKQRNSAPRLYAELQALKMGLKHDLGAFDVLKAQAVKNLNEAGFSSEYIELRRKSDLKKPANGDLELVILAAAKLGSTRLIDNIELI